MQFGNPVSLAEAYVLLAEGEWKILSGGTDIYPSLGGKSPNFNVLDISKIQSMKAIRQEADGSWHIGALVTWSDVIGYDLPACFDALKLSAREVGSIQIQNRATIAGNICNASPAADGVPPLLILDACVKIGSHEGVRELPLKDFILGNRITALRSDEMVIGIKIPASALEGHSAFLKLGARKYLVISISMVAAKLQLADGIIKNAALAVGSCSVVATRLHELEQELIGTRVDADLRSVISNRHLSVLSPIDDVRSTADYRLQASKELMCRAISQVAEGA